MVPDTTRRERLLSLNDPLLHPLIEAPDDAARSDAMEVLLTKVAGPTIGRATGHYLRNEGGLQASDAEDIASTVTLRLVRKLHDVVEREEDAITSLPDYVAMQTFNAIHDLLRLRAPERTRLKNRLRYVLTHDPRLGLWSSAIGPAGGLARYRDTEPRSDLTAISASTATAAMLDRDHPADAVFAILSRAFGAVRLETLLDKVAELWNVVDHPPASLDAVTLGDASPSALDRVEAREALAILWSEIRELREPQRVALLLNLRDSEGTNGLVELLLSNVATFDDVAAAVGLTRETLAEIWARLPLDDLTIAEMLGLKRQQVINLRQAARDRLSRRMSRGRRR